MPGRREPKLAGRAEAGTARLDRVLLSGGRGLR